jgi:hypothetical protein
MVAVVTVSAGEQAVAQDISGDSVRAVAEAKEAARDQLVSSYMLGSVIAAPLAIASIFVIQNGDVQDAPEVLAGPLGLTLLAVRASRSSSPPPDEWAERLESESAAYQTSFRHAYAEEIRRRRLKATAFGALVGVVAGVMILGTAGL